MTENFRAINARDTESAEESLATPCFKCRIPDMVATRPKLTVTCQQNEEYISIDRLVEGKK